MIATYVLLFVCIYGHLSEAIPLTDPDSEYYWPDYVKKFSGYYNDLEETNLERMHLFENNAEYIKRWNQEYEMGLRNFTLGVNFMSAMTEEEKRGFYHTVGKQSSFKDGKDTQNIEKYIGQGFEEIDALYEEFKKIQAAKKEKSEEGAKGKEGAEDEENPKVNNYLDWRDYNVVSPVKYQGRCAGCYAFSAVDAIESSYAIKTGKLVLLSSQMVIDCTIHYIDGNEGCKGGWIHRSYDWLRERGGVALEKDYPFVKKLGTCRQDTRIYLPLKNYIQLPSGDDDYMIATLHKVGPVAVTINSNTLAFNTYRGGGVFDDPECVGNKLTHTGLVVGYGTENGVDYWQVKNSWGEEWGDKGYIKIKRYGNICGVTSLAYVPILKKPPGGWPRSSMGNLYPVNASEPINTQDEHE